MRSLVKRNRFPSLVLLAIAAVAVPGLATAGELRVAVASNFAGAMTAIAERFEARSGHEVSLAVGSTGKHYAQILNGAPFDAFFGADVERAALLEGEGLAVAGSRFTYAVGRLVLWSRRPGYVDPEGAVLDGGEFRHLAIANPLLAPYGRAAREVLEARGLWERLAESPGGRLVRGENVGQTFQFVASGNAELGLVAYSQVRRLDRGSAGSIWEVPPALYTPIEQQAVLLIDSEAGRALLAFVVSDEGLEIIWDHGYDTP